jgi:hypothetical protein
MVFQTIPAHTTRLSNIKFQNVNQTKHYWKNTNFNLNLKFNIKTNHEVIIIVQYYIQFPNLSQPLTK